MFKKDYRIYFTNNECSCFHTTKKQILGIAKQYPNVDYVAQVTKNPFTKKEKEKIIVLNLDKEKI